MKLIFLDIDGVLNGSDLPPLFGPGWPESHLETHLIEKLNKIVKAVEGTKIVISSSWRIRFSLQELIEMLVRKGLEAEIIDVTPRIHGRFSEHIPRGKEIQAWLDATKENVEKFIILDDISNMVHLEPFLIQTDDFVGLTDEHVDRAIKMLEG